MSHYIHKPTTIIPVKLRPGFPGDTTSMRQKNDPGQSSRFTAFEIGPHWEPTISQPGLGEAWQISLGQECPGHLTFGLTVRRDRDDAAICIDSIYCKQCKLRVSLVIHLDEYEQMFNRINVWITNGFWNWEYMHRLFPNPLNPFVHAERVIINNLPAEPPNQSRLFSCCDLPLQTQVGNDKYIPVTLVLIPTQESWTAGMYATMCTLSRQIGINQDAARSSKDACGIK